MTSRTTEAQETPAGWRNFFLGAALYDLVLGAGFFFLYPQIFTILNIQLPNNISYIHLSAAVVFVQGAGYWFVYKNPVRNLDMVRLGVLYKAAYAGLAFYYLAIGQLISPVFALFAVADIVFLLGFVQFIRTTVGSRKTTP